MLSTTAPSNKNFYVQQVLVGGGLQGVAFGVMFATVKAEVEIEDRIDPLDQFGVSFTTSQKGVVTANTQGTPKDADTGIYSLLANPNQELTVTMVEAGPGAPTATRTKGNGRARARTLQTPATLGSIRERPRRLRATRPRRSATGKPCPASPS